MICVSNCYLVECVLTLSSSNEIVKKRVYICKQDLVFVFVSAASSEKNCLLLEEILNMVKSISFSVYIICHFPKKNIWLKKIMSKQKENESLGERENVPINFEWNELLLFEGKQIESNKTAIFLF